MFDCHDKNLFGLFYGILLVRSDGDKGQRAVSLLNFDRCVKDSASVLDLGGLTSYNSKNRFRGEFQDDINKKNKLLNKQTNKQTNK